MNVKLREIKLTLSFWKKHSKEASSMDQVFENYEGSFMSDDCAIVVLDFQPIWKFLKIVQDLWFPNPKIQVRKSKFWENIKAMGENY
jgi:hypothetical protein